MPKVRKSPRKARNRPPAKPTYPRLTQEIAQAIILDILACLPVSDACAKQGIEPSTWRAWVRRGEREPRGDYGQLFRDVSRAQAEAKAELIASIREGDARGYQQGPAKGAQWLLERLYPRQFSQRLQVQVTQELETMLDTAERILAPAQFDALLRELVALDSAGEGPREGNHSGLDR